MSIMKHVTLQKIVAHDFRYDPRSYRNFSKVPLNVDRCSFLWSFAQMTGTRNEYEHRGRTASRSSVLWL